jgi:hypothetical protein
MKLVCELGVLLLISRALCVRDFQFRRSFRGREGAGSTCVHCLLLERKHAGQGALGRQDLTVYLERRVEKLVDGKVLAKVQILAENEKSCLCIACKPSIAVKIPVHYLKYILKICILCVKIK